MPPSPLFLYNLKFIEVFVVEKSIVSCKKKLGSRKLLNDAF